MRRGYAMAIVGGIVALLLLGYLLVALLAPETLQ
jgi:K+-transporting ATPase KdpF subunit